MGNDSELVKEVIMEKQEKKLTDPTEILFSPSKKDTTATTGKGDGYRYNQGKLRFDLVHPKAHEDMVAVLTIGAKKYAARNWENGFSWTSVIASAKRHLSAIEKGEDYDVESGLPHVAHLACNAHFLNAFLYNFPQGDDRPKNYINLPKIGLDIDGVLADFTAAWVKLYPEIEKEPSSWYFDRKIVARFKSMEKKGTLDDFYSNIKPLIKAEELPFEPTCYVTARPVATKISENWLDNLGFPRKKVITVPPTESKVQVLKDAGVEIFIDDSYENFVELNKNGIFCYLYTAPWNTKYDVGHMRLNSLKELPLLK